MNDNVVYPDFDTTLDIPPERVFRGALELKRPLNTGLAIGKDQDGKLYFASSTGHIGEIILLLRRAETFLVDEIRKQYG